MSFSAIKQACTSYYDELPEAILPSVAKSAFFTFTVACVFSARAANGSYDMTVPLIKASAAALASTIHAIATPLFNRTFGTVSLNPWYEMTKSMLTTFTASALMGISLNSALQLSSFKLYYMISCNSFIAWTTNVKNPAHIKENSIYFGF